MSDERERRYRARIDLATGRASVTETHPVDRRTAATVPPVQRPPQTRAEPPRPDLQEGAPVAAPIFPWARAPETTLPQPQDATRRGQPEVHVPSVDATPIPWTAEAEAASASFVPPAAPPAPELALTDAQLEQIAESMVARMRTMLGLAPEEPPVPLMDVAQSMQLDSFFEIHPAGSFVNEREPEPVFDPAGSFVHEP